MPNLVMEYAEPVAERVNIPGLLTDLHQALLGCGLFTPDTVKSRSYSCQDWLVGDEADIATFIHIEVSMLSGRTAAVKRELSQLLMGVLEQHAATINSLTVDIRDMDRDCFLKLTC
ncbi:5-carboxymethyl-2-hydroxymuconate Delta-isomerase [Photobacterium nomapromontoriensis]|uniref:5-carboxymethyl-2-hydroxymuconate Delta-isomerase n=1 Tax=Photobacterium nomapromontoriensis TaxID=2910237 RepID=UPI003D0B97EC